MHHVISYPVELTLFPFLFGFFIFVIIVGLVAIQNLCSFQKLRMCKVVSIYLWILCVLYMGVIIFQFPLSSMIGLKCTRRHLVLYNANSLIAQCQFGMIPPLFKMQSYICLLSHNHLNSCPQTTGEAIQTKDTRQSSLRVVPMRNKTNEFKLI